MRQTRSFRLNLLPPRNTAHIGQMVRNALVAIDAGLFAGEKEALVCHRSARRLLGDVHRRGAVTVAAFQRVIGLEPRSFVERQFEPMIDKFFTGIDGAEQVAPNFLRRLHLARDLVGPVVRDMAIRATRAYA